MRTLLKLRTLARLCMLAGTLVPLTACGFFHDLTPVRAGASSSKAAPAMVPVQGQRDAEASSPLRQPAELPNVSGAFLGYRQAIEVALGRHPLIIGAREQALVFKEEVVVAKSSLYPHLNAYGIQTDGTIRPLSAFNIAGAQNKPVRNIEEGGFRVDQLIYDFGHTLHTIRAQQFGQLAAEKNILGTKATTILRVQQAYLKALRQRRIVEVAEDAVRERGVLRDQIALLYKRQLKSKLDLALISTELKSAEIELVQAKNELRAAFAQLNNAMGVQGPKSYTLEDVKTAEPAGTLEGLIQRGLEERPEVKQSFHLLSRAGERLSAAQALFLPRVSAMGLAGVIHFTDDPRNQFAGARPNFTKYWWGMSLTLSVPLFTGFLLENKVAEARQERHVAEQRKRNISNRVALQVTNAFSTFQAAKEQVKVEERAVRFARSALNLAKARFGLGLASIVDVTTATTELLGAEVRLAEARYSAQASIAAVEYAIGRGYQRF